MNPHDNSPQQYSGTGSIIVPVMGVLLAIISTQLGASLAKKLFPLFTPPGVAALRMTLGAIMLALWFRPWKAKIRRGTIASVCIYGLAIAGMTSMFYLSISRIPLGIAVAIEFLGPLTVAIFSSRRAIDLLWAALAALGLLLLTPLATQAESLDPIGVACALASAVFWGTYIVAGKWAGDHHGPAGAVSLGMIVATIAVTPVALTTVDARLFEPTIFAMALVVAALSGALPFALEMFALRRIPSGTFGVLLSAEPAIGALTGLVVLHEALAFSQWMAILAIVAASAGAMATAASRVPEVMDAP